MKAKELDKYLFPQREVVKAWEDVGQGYELTVHDRTWNWFFPLVTADPVKNQEIVKQIQGCYRLKNSNGEWLYYHVLLSGKDWKGNRKEFNYVEGLIEGMPIFTKDIDPSTNEVVAGTTQVLEMTKVYTIPFTKEKFDGVSKYFDTGTFFAVVDKNGKRYSCNAKEFRDVSYDELIDQKTGLAEYMRSKRPDQLKIGGVR